MLRSKEKGQLVGRFKKSFQSSNSKQKSISKIQTPNHNHLHRGHKPHFRTSKKKVMIENNSSVISINTLVKSSQHDVLPKGKEKSQQVLSKKRKSGSILKHKKNKYEPSRLIEYYSRSSFQKV